MNPLCSVAIQTALEGPGIFVNHQVMSFAGDKNLFEEDYEELFKELTQLEQSNEHL